MTFGHVGGCDAGVGKRRLDRDAPEFVRRRPGVVAEEAADGSAAGGGNDDFGHESSGTKGTCPRYHALRAAAKRQQPRLTRSCCSAA
jgi:hypothetical protein